MYSLFDSLVHRLNAEQRGNEHHADCPFCGKETKRGQRHFSMNEAKGFYCWVCGASGSLQRLAAHLSMDAGPAPTYQHRKPQQERQPAPWQSEAVALVARYAAHPDNVRMWQAYKPVTEATVKRWRFGFGALPGTSHDRLIVPIILDGQVVALRGRSIDGREPKWLSATGSVMRIWNLDGIAAGATVWVMENYVDAAMFMQAYPDWTAVAIGGARALRDDEVATIAGCKPERVIVAYDNDLAGQATGAFLNRLRAEWVENFRQRNPGRPLPKVPEPKGPAVVNQLRKVGVNSLLFRWPQDAPAKADVGWALAEAT